MLLDTICGIHGKDGQGERRRRARLTSFSVGPWRHAGRSVSVPGVTIGRKCRQGGAAGGWRGNEPLGLASEPTQPRPVIAFPGRHAPCVWSGPHSARIALATVVVEAGGAVAAVESPLDDRGPTSPGLCRPTGRTCARSRGAGGTTARRGSRPGCCCSALLPRTGHHGCSTAALYWIVRIQAKSPRAVIHKG